MDNRLILAVLFVTLSWMSMCINAQNSTTASPGNTTSESNMTTAMANNATSSLNATMAPQMTTVMGNNTTMAGNNTTMAGNNTTMAGNNTTVAANMTTAMATTGTTTAAPLVANTTVETLTTEINNTQCGTEQLCASEPARCDPATGGSCFFLAAKQLSGQNFKFGLAGQSNGYIAASLSTDSTLGGNDTTYICANNNGTVKFFGALLDNGQLTVTELRVNSVKGKVNGTTIQCTFAATVPVGGVSTRTTSFSVSISTGSFNSTSNSLGAPKTVLKTPLVNLANPNTTVTNELSANATASPTTMTTNHAITLKQSLMHALLIVAAVLGLAML